MLQRRTNALVKARRVPSALRATLLGGVAQLASQTPVCVPRVAPVAIQPVEPVPASRARRHDTPKHHGKDHGKHHGHGHGKSD